MILNTTSHSGTEATSSAARPLEMCCSATATMPLPPVSSSSPTSAAPPNWRGVILNAALPFLISRNAARRSEAVTNREAPCSSGGIVSMAILMPRYVEPHTT
ncbi:hypothetical protein GCM10020001_048820 [Nonomuraea salmonea]